MTPKEEAKQTAVEWLEKEIDNKDMGEIPMWIYDFCQQAKEMEKQQMENLNRKVMTTREKAEELTGKYWDLNYGWDGVTKDQWAKEGALIAVDEIIGLDCGDSLDVDYWYEVKQEIEKL